MIAAALRGTEASHLESVAISTRIKKSNSPPRAKPIREDALIGLFDVVYPSPNVRFIIKGTMKKINNTIIGILYVIVLSQNKTLNRTCSETELSNSFYESSKLTYSEIFKSPIIKIFPFQYSE